MNWKMLKLATPQEVYNIPANLFVAGFIGSPFMNFIRGPVVTQDSYIGVKIHNDAEEFFFRAPDSVQKGLSGWKGREVIMGIRPEQITDESSSNREHLNIVRCRAKVEVVQATGPDTLILVLLNETPVTCRIHPESHTRVDQSIDLMLDLSKLAFFDPETGARIR